MIERREVPPTGFGTRAFIVGLTAFLAVSEHTSVMVGDDPLERLRVPLVLWRSRMSSLKEKRLPSLEAAASHVDIIPTILWLLGGQRACASLGRSFLDPKAPAPGVVTEDLADQLPGVATEVGLNAGRMRPDFLGASSQKITIIREYDSNSSRVSLLQSAGRSLSSTRTRYLQDVVQEDLEKKMVFLGGPRQVGKTTLARTVAEGAKAPAYFNWDSRAHRKAILSSDWPPETDLLVFDELHKAPKWKQTIKGIWDTREHGERILVTGSSRLDVYRRGGDSLLGRYHYYRLHPFSVREMDEGKPLSSELSSKPPQLELPRKGGDLESLFRLGGFPEPLLSGSERTLKRWQRERFERVFREDIRELEGVRSLSQVELLAALMPERVASPLSFLSLAEDVEVSPKTVKAWVDLLCRNYYVFRVPPYHKRLARALKKESKYYLWDWSEVTAEGPRFENLVASHLLKLCNFYTDSNGIQTDLYYVRDVEKREVDFLVTWEKNPWLLVECKLEPGGSTSSLAYFGERLNVPLRFLVTRAATKDHLDKSSRVRTIPAARFLGVLV